MSHCIARIFESLLRLLRPAPECHQPPKAPAAPPIGVPPVPGRPPESALRGEGSPLVRPYLLAHEERERARRQRARRRALWLAVHGIDIGPRLIHGVEVVA